MEGEHPQGHGGENGKVKGENGKLYDTPVNLPGTSLAYSAIVKTYPTALNLGKY
jgi:hypothetical protein